MNLFYKAGRVCVRLYSKLMFKLDVHWHKEMPVGPKIYIANHPSATDPFILQSLPQEPMSLMVVSTAFTFPIFGEYFRKSGHIKVVPGEGKRAMIQARELLRAGYSVGIFPEGDFSPQSGGYRKPRSGAVRLAFSTGLPVVPVGIYLPRERNVRVASRMSGKPTVGYWYISGPYGITIGNLMNLEGDAANEEKVHQLTLEMMERIKILAHESEFRVRKFDSLSVH
jgi:1-acyl-sn-glycerol-3-phosphate acyltransferase